MAVMNAVYIGDLFKLLTSQPGKDRHLSKRLEVERGRRLFARYQ